jgi:hypothetical protein
MVLRSKPRNHHDDFETQITKPGNAPPPVLRPNWEKPSPPILWPTEINHPSGFEAKPLRSYRSDFDPKPLTNRLSGFEAKALTNRWPWF